MQIVIDDGALEDSLSQIAVKEKNSMFFTPKQWERIYNRINESNKTTVHEQLVKDGIYPFTYPTFTKHLNIYLDSLNQ